jgi:hypothetical protein
MNERAGRIISVITMEDSGIQGHLKRLAGSTKMNG